VSPGQTHGGLVLFLRFSHDLGDDIVHSVELFGGHQFPRAMGALGLASTWADHYAAAAMYLRLNGILPPSAQPKK